jgi:carboxypeptidase-like protein
MFQVNCFISIIAHAIQQMKRSFYITVYFLLICNWAFTQSLNSIKGKVTGAVNGLPVAGCSVFINSTSRGTVTDEKGEFILQNLPEGKYELIISSIGYETFVYDFSNKQFPLQLQITLKQKATELSAVTVEPFEKDGWQHWGKTFLDNFIGKTDNAQKCTIKNYKVLRFRFSKKNNRLTVSADEPLIIENKALGYFIKYQLEEFYCDFKNRVTLYLGYPLFQQMDASRKKQMRWEEKRRNVYFGSIIHFMKSLYHSQLQEQGFQVIRNLQITNIEKQRVKELYKSIIPAADTFQVHDGAISLVSTKKIFSADSASYYNSVLTQPDFYNKYILLTADSLVSVNEDGTKSIFFTGKLHIIYNSKDKPNLQSEIYLVTPSPVYIEKNGGYYPPQEMIASGYWGFNEKVSNELPIDFSTDNN